MMNCQHILSNLKAIGLRIFALANLTRSSPLIAFNSQFLKFIIYSNNDLSHPTRIQIIFSFTLWRDDPVSIRPFYYMNFPPVLMHNLPRTWNKRKPPGNPSATGIFIFVFTCFRFRAKVLGGGAILVKHTHKIKSRWRRRQQRLWLSENQCLQ